MVAGPVTRPPRSVTAWGRRGYAPVENRVRTRRGTAGRHRAIPFGSIEGVTQRSDSRCGPRHHDRGGATYTEGAGPNVGRVACALPSGPTKHEQVSTRVTCNSTLSTDWRLRRGSHLACAPELRRQAFATERSARLMDPLPSKSLPRVANNGRLAAVCTDRRCGTRNASIR